jgi:hypothetical protein
MEFSQRFSVKVLSAPSLTSKKIGPVPTPNTNTTLHIWKKISLSNLILKQLQ